MVKVVTNYCYSFYSFFYYSLSSNPDQYNTFLLENLFILTIVAMLCHVMRCNNNYTTEKGTAVNISVKCYIIVYLKNSTAHTKVSRKKTWTWLTCIKVISQPKIFRPICWYSIEINEFQKLSRKKTKVAHLWKFILRILRYHSQNPDNG